MFSRLHKLTATAVVTVSAAAYGIGFDERKAKTLSKRDGTHRIVSYNILSSHLADPKHFKYCDPKDLDVQTRLQRIQGKLQREIENGAIINLQEISHTFAGPLHSLFQNSSYYCATALYGSKFSNYMGVGIAWPDKYKALDVKIQRLADVSKDWPKTQKKRDNAVVAWLLAPLRFLWPAKKEFSAWEVASNRHNQLVAVKLQDKQTGDVFWVATYHMPCLFGTPQKRSVMQMHASLYTSYVADIAGGDPFVITGDFNIQPGSSTYQLLTQGRLDSSHEDYPHHPDPSKSKRFASCPALSSVYAAANGAEPDYTNNARTQGPQFIECLDYIFVSKDQWHVNGVDPTPPRAAATAPYPDKNEPSDHILIGANVKLR